MTHEELIEKQGEILVRQGELIAQATATLQMQQEWFSQEAARAQEHREREAREDEARTRYRAEQEARDALGRRQVAALERIAQVMSIGKVLP